MAKDGLRRRELLLTDVVGAPALAAPALSRAADVAAPPAVADERAALIGYLQAATK